MQPTFRLIQPTRVNATLHVTPLSLDYLVNIIGLLRYSVIKYKVQDVLLIRIQNSELRPQNSEIVYLTIKLQNETK